MTKVSVFKYIAALALLLVIVSCGNNPDEDTDAPTATVSPTATASVTPSPTASPTIAIPTATPVERDSMEVDSIVTPICLPADPNGPYSEGTAPGAQPTAIPSPGDRGIAIVTAEMEAYLRRVSPVIVHTLFWEDWLDENWQTDNSTEEAAAILHMVGIKIAQACNALALVSPVPPEASELHSAINDATNDRLNWVKGVVAQLNSGSGSGFPDRDSGAESLINQVSSEMMALIANYPGMDIGDYSLSDPVLGIETDMPEGWFATPDNLNLVLAAPPEKGGTSIASLGPDSWRLGASVRVRRLRNSGSLTVAEASVLFNGIVTRQGKIASSVETEVNGFPALLHELVTADNWHASMTVVIAGQFTYFVETGCWTVVPDGCDEVNAVVESLRFNAS